MNRSIDKQKVDQALEALCQLGCVTVNEIIQEIERDVLPKAAEKLNRAECKCLAEELKNVMQVYK